MQALAHPSTRTRGPARFLSDWRLDPVVLLAYGEVSFCVLEGVLWPEELADTEADLADILDHLPAHN